jgi:hypothetical protein
MTCPLCEARKGKRVCPARGALICSTCCGQKRVVEIDCPEDCVYLTGGHAAGWDGRARDRERDGRRLGPHLSGLSEAQQRLLLLALAGVVGLHARRPELDDALLLEAVVALRKTTETRERGVIYEHPASDPRAQGLVADLDGLFEARDDDGVVHRPSDRDLGQVLRALEGALRGTLAEREGPAAFLATAARLTGRLIGSPPARSRPLIIEP